MKLLIKSLIFSMLFPLLVFAFPQSFSGDSSYQNIRHLSETIGPRPMGSAAEAAALNWAVSRYSAFGADSAFVFPFTTATARRLEINTRSGIAVGIFKGKTDSAIVIGGHIDSAGEDIPGANDDGSGSATVIELARLWSQRDRHYTMIFCNFGGEERGLLGSTHFVDHYPELDKVALMISADMAGSDEDIIAMIETNKAQTPAWLVKDAFRVADETGYSQLYYPTRFSVLNRLSENGAGSDHMPFLNNDIPAIDFTAGINDSPIHSAQDKIDFITPAMLYRYGNFIDHLLSHYQQNGIPEGKTENYFLWDSLAGLFFIPHYLIVTFNVIAFVVLIVAFIRARKNRLILAKELRIRWSGWKLFLVLILLAVFSQFGEALIQLVKGLRFPWYDNIYPYLIYALIWLIGGAWVALQLTRKWRFTDDAYAYVLRATIFFLIFGGVTAVVKADFALYPALAMFLFAHAVMIEKPWIKSTLSFLAPLPLLFLLFHEMFPFFARSSAGSGFAIDNNVKAFFYSAGITIFLVLWFLPFIYTSAYAVVTNDRLKNFLGKLKQPAGGYALLSMIVLYGGYLYAIDSYSDKWRPAIQVNARYELPGKKATLKVIGNEYFRDVQISSDSLSGTYTSGIHKLKIPTAFELDWIILLDSTRILSGEKDTVFFDWTLVSTRPWNRSDITVQVDSGHVEAPAANFNFTQKDSLLRFTFLGFPGDTLHIAGSYNTEPGVGIRRRLEARFTNVPVPIEVKSALANVRYRTTIVRKDTLR